MAKLKERESAIALRKKGESIGSIARRLSVSKSTVSGWCRDIELSDSAIEKIAKRGKEKSVRGLLHYSESLKKKRILDTKRSMRHGANTLGTLSNRDIYCIGLGLYWGEGYKQGSQEFGFTNSDPSMIVFYVKWLEIVFNIKRTDLILRVSINDSHRKRAKDVEKYWSKRTGVPLKQFTKLSLIKTPNKKTYSNAKTHMGTLRIKVKKGTSKRREIIGAINSIRV